MSTNTPNPKALARPSAQKPLNVPVVRFCQKVAEGKTLYEAYTDAGYEPRPTRVATRMAAYRLLRRPAVLAQAREFRRQAVDAARVTAERVIQALAWMAFADRRKLLGPDGELLPPNQWPEDVAATIEAIEVKELTGDGEDGEGKEARGTVRKVRTTRQIEALRLLARVLHMDAAPADPGPAYGPLVVISEAGPDAR